MKFLLLWHGSFHDVRLSKDSKSLNKYGNVYIGVTRIRKPIRRKNISGLYLLKNPRMAYLLFTSMSIWFKQISSILNSMDVDLVLSYDIRENHFDVILDFYYLERSLIPKIKKGLRNNGLLFFETYTAEQSRFGHPRNPEYLLKPNELLNFFLDFFILYYHERIEESKAVAGIIAQKI